MSLYKKYDEDFFMFLEGGFIAINQSDEDSAKKLFAVCSLLQPNNSIIEIGRGYLLFCQLKLQEAAVIFKKVLDKEPKNEMAKSFLGLTLSWMPSEGAQGEKLLEEVSHSSDNMIQKLSTTALDFREKFIKKAPSPASLATPKKQTKKKEK
ncbi:MAG: hypothetical protein WCP39_06985 [Chlamydiota bacterium]